MKKSTLAILIAVVALLALGGIVYAVSGSDDDSAVENNNSSSQNSNTDTSGSSESSPAPDSESEANTSEVEMIDSSYSPSQITVKKGTTVTWTNRDSVSHDVVPDNESDEFKKSTLLGEGESYSVTFDTVGTYTYHCTPHPFMKGTVTVIE